VPTSIPQNTAVPIARWLADDAPVAIYIGTTPKINANEVIKMGRKRNLAARNADSAMDLPALCKSWANSIIIMAFFALKPITVTIPTVKYTSLL